VLRPNGTIFFTEPNMLNPQIAIQKNVPWVKRKLGDSPDETAFFRRPLRRLLEVTGFRDVRINSFDFLHPKTPTALISGVSAVGRFLESVPVLSEFAGSLYILHLNERHDYGSAERISKRSCCDLAQSRPAQRE